MGSGTANFNFPLLFLRFWTCQINSQEVIIHACARDLHSLGQHKSALELTGGNTAMGIGGAALIVLLAANDPLIVLNADFKITAGEAGDGQNNTQDG